MSVKTPPEKIPLERLYALTLKAHSLRFSPPIASKNKQPLSNDENAMSGNPNSTLFVSLAEKNQSVIAVGDSGEGSRALPFNDNTPVASPLVELAYIVTTLRGELNAEEKENTPDETHFLAWVKPISLYLGSLSLLGFGTYYALKSDVKRDVKRDVKGNVLTATNDVIPGPLMDAGGEIKKATPSQQYPIPTMGEDNIHVFSRNDLGASVDEYSHSQITRLPIDSALHVGEGMVVQPALTIVAEEPDKLTFRGCANASDENDASLHVSVMGEEFTLGEHALALIINLVNNKPIVDIASLVAQILSPLGGVDSNTHSLTLIKTDAQHYLMAWVEENHLFLQQVNVHNGELIIDDEPSLIGTTTAADNPVVLDTLLFFNELEQAALSWVGDSEGEGISDFMQWFDQAMKPLADAENRAALSMDTDNAILFHQLPRSLHFQVYREDGSLQPIQAINTSTQGWVRHWQAVQTDDGFFVAWIQSHEALTSLFGRFYTSEGRPLSSSVALKSWPEQHEVDDLQVVVSESDHIHLTWREREEGGDKFLLSMEESHLSQHAVDTDVSMIEVRSTAHDFSNITLTSSSDDAVYFQLDSTGLVRVLDAESMNNATQEDFALPLIADGKKQAVLDYSVSFPETESITLHEKTLYTLSLEAEAVPGIESFTVAKLLDTGLLSPINDTVILAPPANADSILTELYAQSDDLPIYLQNAMLG